MADNMTMKAQGRYESLDTNRSPFLQRARECAELTIPGLMPPEGTTGTMELPTPFQGVGARGTNNLAAKLLLALFPPGGNFFRLTVDESVLSELKKAAGAGGDPTAEIEEALQDIEQTVVTRFDQKGNRTVCFETVKQLIVCGNALLQILKDGSLKMYRLDSYMVKRDLEGNPMEIITKEMLSLLNLPPKAREIVEADPEYAADKDKSGEDTIALYTRVSRTTRGWSVHQEILDTEVPGSKGSYPKKKPAFLPLRWNAVPGEDYGRGHCEEYLGDLRSLESLSRSIVEFAAAVSKILFLVNEAGVTSKKKLVKAPSGSVIDGNAKDVEVLQVEKFADFKVAESVATKIENRLEEAFLLNKSIQRNAERVTAEEIRFMASELEQTLGGVYSTLAQEMQRPLVIRLMSVMTRSKDLPALPDDAIAPQIITGLEGLGRSSDLMKLDVLVNGMAQTFGPEAVSEYVNPGAYMQRRATALGIEIEGVIRSEEEVTQMRQQKMMAEMAGKVGPSAMNAMSAAAEGEREKPTGGE